jgi:hypothetical protein
MRIQLERGERREVLERFWCESSRHGWMLRLLKSSPA